MSTINYCRLCVNIGMDFKSLYDESGQTTEVYDLTAKYFDPSILNTDDSKHLSMICFQCWDHIWDFNNFQQAVLVAQSNLDAIKHTDIPPESGDLPGTSVLRDLLQVTSSVKEKNEGCIYVSESEEESSPFAAEVINENFIADIEANAEDATNVDLTLDDDDMQQVEFDESVGTFLNGQFDNLSAIMPQTHMESIDLDSDSNSECEFGKRYPSETSTASETCNENPSQGNHETINHNQVNQMFVTEQLWMFYNHAQRSCDEDFQLFTENRGFNCFICLEKCFGLKDLFTHFNRFHLTKTVQIMCCKRSHEGIPSISKHITSHYKKPISYQCQACCKSYTAKGSLNRHMLKAHPG